MSTRSIIATPDGKGGFVNGIYMHYDGYPTGMGANVHRLVREQGAKKFLDALDTAPQGWESIDYEGSRDLFAERYNMALDAYHEDKHERLANDIPVKPFSFSEEHVPSVGVRRTRWLRDGSGGRDEYVGPDEVPRWRMDWSPDDKDKGEDKENSLKDSWVEWVYVVDPETNSMEILKNNYREGPTPVGRVRFDDPSPNWEAMECGHNYEHCSHVASHHFPEAANTRYGIDVWMGREDPFITHDASAAIVNGTRYELTGNGKAQHGLWYASATNTETGKREDVPIHTPATFRSGERPESEALPGVTLVFPPRANETEEFYYSAKEGFHGGSYGTGSGSKSRKTGTPSTSGSRRCGAPTGNGKGPPCQNPVVSGSRCHWHS